MPPPNRLDPLAALRILTTQMNRRAASAFAPEDAPAGFLAEAVECDAPTGWSGAGRADGERIATRNGYALPGSVRAGDRCIVCGVLGPRGALDADGLHPRAGDDAPGLHSSETPARPRVWRVETGAAIPEGCDRVAGVGDAVIVGKREISLEKVPVAGAGWIHPARVRFEAGTFLSRRLRGLLAARGVRLVSVRPPFAVAVGVVGDDIAEPGASPDPGGRVDRTTPWLEHAVRRLGLEAMDLGVLPDSAAAVRDAILHVRGRADALVLLGGIGDGLLDRTVESVQRFEAHVVFDGLDLETPLGLFFAKTLGIDVLGLCGRPLGSAAGFDLFLRPALLARWGANGSHWDWSRALWPLEPAPGEVESPEAGSGWRVEPVERTASARGEAALRKVAPREDLDPFLPIAPGQDGWGVLEPIEPGDSGAGVRSAYFQPLALDGP